MENVLIAAANEKTAQALTELILSRYPAAAVLTTDNGASVRRMCLERSFDFVMISMPLKDEQGAEAAIHAAADLNVGVILIVRAEYAEDISAKVSDYGVFVIEKPIHRPFFFSAARFIMTAQNKVSGLVKEAETLKNKMSELSVISRAKCALMEYLLMSEKQAHRYIEKQAMDMRVTRLKVAENILKTYERQV
ncbi:MAG: ANTAR domain-containing protein [Clostridiales bacterium]|jgi:response regulator NasT|nr:ANTAR domain-containing protein [Clostridiales bacterium]